MVSRVISDPSVLLLNNAVDPQSLAAMQVLESAVCNQSATGPSDAESTTDVEAVLRIVMRRKPTGVR